MWEWFTTNAVWILIVSALVLSALLIARQRVQESIKKAVPKKWHKTLEKSIKLALWVIGVIALVIIAVALAAIRAPVPSARGRAQATPAHPRPGEKGQAAAGASEQGAAEAAEGGASHEADHPTKDHTHIAP